MSNMLLISAQAEFFWSCLSILHVVTIKNMLNFLKGSKRDCIMFLSKQLYLASKMFIVLTWIYLHDSKHWQNLWFFVNVHIHKLYNQIDIICVRIISSCLKEIKLLNKFIPFSLEISAKLRKHFDDSLKLTYFI